ncbi:MAG: outer membrane beta-barrel protein [Bacteroidales bacterium]
MKKVNFTLTIVCILGVIICHGQPDNIKNTTDTTRTEIGITAGIYNNNIFRFTELRKTSKFDDGPGIQYGLNFMLPMDTHLSMGFGLHYIKTKNKYHSLILQPDTPETYTHYTELIYLPVRFRYELTKWLFLQGGLSISIELQNENNLNQNGMGVLGGATIHYSPFRNLNFGIEPELHLTSLFPVPQEFYHHHFFLAGVNTRVAWYF